MKMINLTGEQYGLWTVLERTWVPGNKRTFWLCECVCGHRKAVEAGSLNSGISTSCGCQGQGFSSRGSGPKASIRSHWKELLGNAKRRRIEVTLTIEEFSELVTGACEYCGQQGEPFLGIDRVDSDTGYHLMNCVPCCWICNRFKGPDLSQSQLISHARSIVERFT